MLNSIVSTKNLTHDEWLQYRRQGIGGSDVSILTGINKYKSVYELWMDKTGQIPPQEAGEAAYWGNVLEPIVREEFTKRTGYEVYTPEEIFQHSDYPFMLANLDGIIYDADGEGPFIFEAKTANMFASDDWDISVPEAYLLQIQHYMAVTGFKGTYIAVLIGGNNYKYYFVERNDKLISLIIDLEKHFWNLVETNTPPDINGTKADTLFMATLYPNSIDQGVIELPSEAMDYINEYQSINDEINDLTLMKDKALNNLKSLLGDNQTGQFGSYTLTWKTILTNRFDSTSFKKEYPDEYHRYLKSSHSRRFSIKKEG